MNIICRKKIYMRNHQIVIYVHWVDEIKFHCIQRIVEVKNLFYCQRKLQKLLNRSTLLLRWWFISRWISFLSFILMSVVISSYQLLFDISVWNRRFFLTLLVRKNTLLHKITLQNPCEGTWWKSWKFAKKKISENMIDIWCHVYLFFVQLITVESRF
jgi:hypothetical protein